MTEQPNLLGRKPTTASTASSATANPPAGHPSGRLGTQGTDGLNIACDAVPLTAASSRASRGPGAEPPSPDRPQAMPGAVGPESRDDATHQFHEARGVALVCSMKRQARAPYPDGYDKRMVVFPPGHQPIMEPCAIETMGPRPLPFFIFQATATFLQRVHFESAERTRPHHPRKLPGPWPAQMNSCPRSSPNSLCMWARRVLRALWR